MRNPWGFTGKHLVRIRSVVQHTDRNRHSGSNYNTCTVIKCCWSCVFLKKCSFHLSKGLTVILVLSCPCSSHPEPLALSQTRWWLQQLHSDCTVPCRCDCPILHSCKFALPQTGKRLFPDVILPWSCLYVCVCAFVLQMLIKHVDCFFLSYEIGRHPAEVDHDFSELWTSALQAHEVSNTATDMPESTDRPYSHVSQQHPVVVIYYGCPHF